MDFTRFNKNTIRRGAESKLLLDNPVFFEAVEAVLNKYSELEENIITCSQEDYRDMQSKLVHYARMRRALLDAVNELDNFVIAGDNAAHGDLFGE